MKSVKLAVVSASTALSVIAVGTAVTGAEEAKVSACAAAENKASVSKENAAAAQANVDKKIIEITSADPDVIHSMRELEQVKSALEAAKWELGAAEDLNDESKPAGKALQAVLDRKLMNALSATSKARQSFKRAELALHQSKENRIQSEINGIGVGINSDERLELENNLDKALRKMSEADEGLSEALLALTFITQDIIDDKAEVEKSQEKRHEVAGKYIAQAKAAIEAAKPLIEAAETYSKISVGNALEAAKQNPEVLKDEEEAKRLNDQAVLDQKAAEECVADEAAKADKNQAETGKDNSTNGQGGKGVGKEKGENEDQGDGDNNQDSEGNSKFFGILAAVLGGLGLAGLVAYFMPMIMKFFIR